MPKVTDFDPVEQLTGNELLYSVQGETDKKATLDQVKDFVLEERQLTDEQIKDMLKDPPTNIKINDPKW